MNKKGILPVVLVTLVGLAALTVLMIGTMEFLHETLTGGAAAKPYEETGDSTRFPVIILQKQHGQEVLEECVLVRTARANTHLLKCK